MSKTYGYSDGNRGFVRYKGVEQEFDVGNSEDRDQWLSDDNAVGDFDEYMHGSDFDRKVDQAYEKAEREHNRRQRIKDRIKANEDSIAMLQDATANLNQNVAPEALPPEKPLSERAQRAMAVEFPKTDYTFGSAADTMPKEMFRDVMMAEQQSNVFKDSDESTASDLRLDPNALTPINAPNDPVANLNPVAADFATTHKNKVREEIRRQNVPTRGPQSYNQLLHSDYV